MHLRGYTLIPCLTISLLVLVFIIRVWVIVEQQPMTEIDKKRKVAMGAMVICYGYV
jgi:hypothetical protein